MSNHSRIAFVVLIILAAAFRTNGLFENTFHADEALFASWARQIAVWRDPLLSNQLVDKPPLLFYMQALFYPLQGPVQWAARLPNYIASLLTIPLTALLAWRLYRSQVTMILVAALLAFSPMAIQFSASAFIDPLMSSLIVAALVVVAGCQVSSPDQSSRVHDPATDWAPTFAGMLFGLAVISKYQAWLFMPLLIGLAIIAGWGRAQWGRWLLGFLPMLLVQIGWELSRGQELSLLESQWQSYGGLRLAWSWELWPRLQEWATHWSHILGSPVIEISLLLAMPLLLALLIDNHDRSTVLDRLFVIFVVAYTLLLWFVAVPVWDRYVLALLPFLALILARFAVRVGAYIQSAILPSDNLPRWAWQMVIFAPIAIVVLQAPAITEAYQGSLPIGAAPSADEGAAEISQALKSAPYGTVLYDHWYSWQWRYHLFDDRVYISWFPDPDSLVEDLRAFANDRNSRFIVLPNSALAMPIKRAVAEAGYMLEPVLASGNDADSEGMVLYQIELSGEAIE